ncbi:hypothetical protein [Alkalicoccobacillus porphyridii]|uniref:Uncharacterized protein n=1 Tax=Alkalicoccobacillus porphyridii TaxID=2597270 RepID=A0A554A253_9BACI|nr:hypothetical protein [Alkalicoccobacillus porphyridii]TSB47772.1 hypothetical protein FN960_04445 [Alkalicoccobacillus porphyridii]
MVIQLIRRKKRLSKIKKVKEGDGHRLKKPWLLNMFTRSLFHVEITNKDDKKILYTIVCKYFVEEPRADLYKDGIHIAYSKLPAAFPVEDGFIEMENGGYGINRIHYETEKEGIYSIYPDKRSIRGGRLWIHKRFPKISSFIAVSAIVILLTSIVIGLPQLVETLSDIPWVAENIGTFESPIVMPSMINYAMIGAGMLAGVERTLMLRSHWLIDMETNHWDD